MARNRKMFSYVVDHDYGYAPNPENGLCTLVRCKYSKSKRRNLVEMAEVGDWIVGTVGKHNARGACADKIGHLLYAMKVTGKIPLESYMAQHLERCDAHEVEQSERENISKRFALLSDCYVYFGRNAIKLDDLPQCSHPFAKQSAGYRCDFDGAYISSFESWISKYQMGKLGEPCLPSNECIPCEGR